MSIPNARDTRISELENKLENLQNTVHGQRNTIDALHLTNQLITEQLEETSKQLASSNQQFLTSRGLYSENDGESKKSLSIDQTVINEVNPSLESSDAGLYGTAQSILVDDDDVYSSGDDIETYQTKISDDHELLPLKQGTLKKKSENMHRYNNRYVILYPSFLLYYDQCPIKTLNRQKAANNDINHPKGTIYLRNYHVSIRRDDKKKRYDITFVPHQSAVAMGLAATDARIRFRCKSINELTDWTEKIRTAITSANSGFIKYDIRTDFIYNDLSNWSKIKEDTDNNDIQETDEDMKVSDKKKTRMFDINDLKAMMKQEDKLQNEIESKNLLISKMTHELESIRTDLAIKETEVESEQTLYQRRKHNLEAKMVDVKEHEKTLKEEISNLRSTMTKLEQKHHTQHKKIKKYKYHEQDIQRNIQMMQKWNQKVEENSLAYLGSLYPNSASKQLLENCQRGCMILLEETYKAFNQNDRASSEICAADEDINECKSNKTKQPESKICKEIMSSFITVLRKHVKGTINYVNLQQAHHALMDDIKILKENLKQYEDDDGNSLEDNALIMASVTASLF